MKNVCVLHCHGPGSVLISIILSLGAKAANCRDCRSQVQIPSPVLKPQTGRLH